MCKTESKNTAKDKEVKIMSPIEMIEAEKINYINEMKDYLNRLKGLTPKEARETSYNNLLNSGIIEKDGKFSERYKYSRKNEENKR